MRRKSNAPPRKKVTFYLEERLMQVYDLLLKDPVSRRNAYGKKSTIVQTLLQRLVEAARHGQTTIEVSDLVAILTQNVRNTDDSQDH